MMKRGMLVFVLLPFLTALASACGSSSDSGSSGTSYTLDNVCDEIPAKICALDSGCCTSSGIGFDEAGCESYQASECQKNVAEVKAGTMTFHPEKIDSCLTSSKPVFDACRIALPDLPSFLPDLADCRAAFVGQLDLGAACDRDAECKPSGDPKKFTSCPDDTKKCTQLSIVGSGAACSYDPGALAICDTGLYCDVTTPTPPSGTCKTAVAKGQTCKLASLECGLGFYCDPSSQTCVDGKAEGDTCVTGLECKSVVCTATKCAAPDPVVHADDCGM